MLKSDMILNFLKFNGPSLPTAVARNIKEDPLIASAYLGELKSSGKVKISRMKIGTSPLYYLVGQEAQLANFANKVFSGRDLQVFSNLMQEKVLRENNIDLIHKVALRKMNDFAIPLQVDMGNGSEIFWKWYMSNDNEVAEKIRTIVYGVVVEVAAPVQEAVQNQAQVAEEAVVEQQVEAPVQAEAPAQAEVAVQIEPKEAVVQEPLKQKKVVEEKVQEKKTEVPHGLKLDYPPNTAEGPRGDAKIEEVPQVINTAVEKVAEVPAAVVEEVENKVVVVEAEEVQTKLEAVAEAEINSEEKARKEKVASVKEEKVETKIQEPVEAEPIREEQKKKPVPKKEPAKKAKKKVEKVESKKEEKKENKSELKEVKKKEKVQETVETTEVIEKKETIVDQSDLVQKIKEKLMKGSKRKIGDFLPEVIVYFEKEGAIVESHEIVRKNGELNLKVSIPSKFGRISVFCKAKNKSKCDEKDVSAAYMEAQMDKMPLLFLYTGTVSKKAEEFAESGEFVNLMLLKIDF